MELKNDPVHNPSHYTSHPSGVECIQITRHMGFNLGNAVKYIWRAGLKGAAIQDLEKARFYIDDEIARLKSTRRVCPLCGGHGSYAADDGAVVVCGCGSATNG